MKMTNGEIRGSIVLLVLLIAFLAVAWCTNPGRLTGASYDAPSGEVTYFTDDSALINERADKEQRDRKARSAAAKAGSEAAKASSAAGKASRDGSIQKSDSLQAESGAILPSERKKRSKSSKRKTNGHSDPIPDRTSPLDNPIN